MIQIYILFCSNVTCAIYFLLTGTLEKGFDQSTCLGVCHLIPMGLFHDDQVLWQGLKARVGQWILQMEGVGKSLGG